MNSKFNYMNISKSGLMILVLIISFLSVGCENNSVDSVKDNGSIKRYVYDFSTDEPLANCTITLFPTIGSTRSTDDGLFYFPSLAHGSYEILFEKEGYKPYNGDVWVLIDKNTELNIVLKK